MTPEPKQDALERVTAEARAAGLSSGDLIRYMRARDGLSVRPMQRERLRATEAWREALALGEQVSGLPADEILTTCRQVEYVAARDAITARLMSVGWRIGEIAAAMDQNHATVITAKNRIARREAEKRGGLRVVGKGR